MHGAENKSSEKPDKSSVGDEPSRMSMLYLRAFQDRDYNVYLGSVPEGVVGKRRTANKVARKARRVNRGRR